MYECLICNWRGEEPEFVTFEYEEGFWVDLAICPICEGNVKWSDRK